MKKPTNSFLLAFICLSFGAIAQENTNHNKFRQLGQELPTPNVYRTASGAPGHLYWQQKADYIMDITLDDDSQRVYGVEEITYTNNSPDQLDYLWIQLDQNMRSQESQTYKIQTGRIDDGMSLGEYFRLFHTFPGGFNLDYVRDGNGEDYEVKVNHTMMRINLDEPLKPGAAVKINIKWWYNINDRMEIGGRSGYEYFKEEDNYLYT
ncbi:MAG: M1 family peptidase, partial [Bacteroidia bacterium]|nr:M1 family peptidase [Bacteroidia bacterium]